MKQAYEKGTSPEEALEGMELVWFRELECIMTNRKPVHWSAIEMEEEDPEEIIERMREDRRTLAIWRRQKIVVFAWVDTWVE